MLPIKTANSQKVFDYFEKLSAIPRGSGNMKGVAQFCQDFAEAHNLKYIRDNADNIVIFKDATTGYENAEPIILQGHLDMVCQKTPDCNIDFEKDGLTLYTDGDFLKARGTTLGADNGIAVAMVLTILEMNDFAHPAIEAVFTTDEEIGMIGAKALDMSVLKAKRMINLDSEKDDNVTVSCAGGSDFKVNVPLETQTKSGSLVTLELGGLKGGHSGAEIDKNRINANMIAGRILSELGKSFDFGLVSINGGDKANAIPNRCAIEICVDNAAAFCSVAQKCFGAIKNEIADREPDFALISKVANSQDFNCFSDKIKNKIIYTLLCAPNGIVEMSAEIEGLVQTSLNLGVLITNQKDITLHFALRSNKKSALAFLEQRLAAFFDMLNLSYETFGHYPPWEYKADSALRDIYCSVYADTIGKNANIEAIHAGLECGVFASAIDGFDCIAIGPTLYDIHTTGEKLSISSTENVFNMLIKTLQKLK